MRAIVLTYHSGNLAGNDYSTNNLVALAEDLSKFARCAFPSFRCAALSTL
jgi:hypothetical protein